MQIFLDSNVYLSFYRRAADDIKKLVEISEHVSDEGIDLILPENVILEFRRNREKVISGELNRLSSQLSEKFNYPRMADDHPMVSKITELTNDRNKLLKELLQELRESAVQNTLAADKVISNLFDVGRRLPTTEAIFSRAKYRSELRSPPGKTGSIGDAINWECLLKHCTDYDLHIVTDDNDFRSPLSNTLAHDFLRNEWSKNSKHSLYIYKQIGEFLRSVLPDYALNYNNLSDYWIGKFEETDNPKLVKEAIKHIKGRDLSFEQGQRLIEAPKVELIMADQTVRSFYEFVLQEYGAEERYEYHELADILYNYSERLLTDFR